MEHFWKYTDGIKSKSLEKNMSSATLLTTNTTWTGQGSNPGLGCEWSANNSLRPGTRCMKADVQLNYIPYIVFHIV
jgi:hypothetical protein